MKKHVGGPVAFEPEQKTLHTLRLDRDSTTSQCKFSVTNAACVTTILALQNNELTPGKKPQIPS